MDKIIESFQGGRLQIDFVNLALVQNSTNKPIEYRGPGYIRQTENDGLMVRLYSVETKNTDLVSDFNSFGCTKSGTLYNDADYYTLTGISIDGSAWTARHLLPQCSWLAGNPNPVVNAAVSNCERGQRSNALEMRLHYFEKADVPSLINRVTFAACGFDFDLQKKDDSFTIDVKSSGALPDHLEVKIEEAIRFLLAQTVSCRVVERPNQHLHLYSRYPSSHRSRLAPPISRGGPGFHGHSWQLFAAYLAYVLPGAGPYWHACSNHLHNAREASANALDAWAIGLGVAVEGLAGLLPIELDPNVKARLTSLQAFINAQVSGNPDHRDFAPRIAGMVNGLTSIRAIDRMNELAATGGTLPGLVKDWQKLRNRGVHPDKRGGDLSQSDYQRLLDEVYHVTALMYHIVFALIGYKGPFTDYAERGFQERTYPPVAVTNPPRAPGPSPAARPVKETPMGRRPTTKPARTKKKSSEPPSSKRAKPRRARKRPQAK
ncbi:MAG TPA: hypothetical protein VKX28_31150 [Xanthobacteraceae bacterium]|nr:hypothetical protein [Xanthobacteraceae bacterium]